MKKLVVFMAVAISAICVSGARRAPHSERPTFYAVQERIELVKTIAATNVAAARGLVLPAIDPLRNVNWFPSAEYDDYCNDVDAAFFDLGLSGSALDATSSKSRFPKIDQRAFESSGLETSVPYLITLARKRGCMARPMCFNEKNSTAEELIGLMNENLALVNGACPYPYNSARFDRLRKSFQAACVRPVRKYLVRQGKSFVTKDGVNPSAELMDELNTALNAPYLNGLNEWLSKIGIEGSVDISHLPTEDEVEKLRTDVLNADKDLSKRSQFILRICLGVNGYNAFVKKYNGEQ